MTELLYFGLIFGGMLAGIFGERMRADWERSDWRRRRRERRGQTGLRVVPGAPGPVLDASEQLRVIIGADFEKRPLLSRQEYRFFKFAEETVAAARRGWRVMAQVNLGEILACKDPRAFGAINSKRVDFLIICPRGLPVAAIEYQGGGHYQGSAAARDAVKKEALRRAGVRYIEIDAEHEPEDLGREIKRVMRVEGMKAAG